MSRLLYQVFIPDNDSDKLEAYKDIGKLADEISSDKLIDSGVDRENNTDKDDEDLLNLDSLIMDYFKQGLLYFSEILTKYTRLKDPITIYQSKHYLDSYLLSYIRYVIKPSEIQYLLNNNPDMVLNFHKKLVISGLDADIIKYWVPKLYDSLKEMFRKQYSQISHSMVLSTLIGCPTFREHLYTQELSNSLTAKTLEHNTLFGILIKYMDSEEKITTLEKVLYRLIYQYDEEGYSCFTRWLSLVQRKNRRRKYTEQQSVVVSSDSFMLNTFRLLLYIWNNNFKNSITLDDIENNDNEKAIILTCVYKQIELTVLPILTKYHYYLNRLEDLEEISYNAPYYNYLNRFRESIQQKISHYELLVRDNIKLTYHGVLSYYTWIISYLINDNKMEVMPDSVASLVENIFDYIVLSNTIYSSLLKKEETLVYPIIKLALYVFTNKFKTNNPHVKLLAFRCFYQLESYLENYQIPDEINVFKSIVNLYTSVNQSMIDDYYINPKILLITFLEDHQTLYNYKKDLESEQLEKFINLLISDTNHHFENYVDRIKYISRNTTGTVPETYYEVAKDIFRKIIEHFRIIRNLISGQNCNFTEQRVFNNLSICLIFNTRHVIKLSVSENIDTTIQSNVLKLAREITKTYLHFISNPIFIEELLDENQNFNMEEAKMVFSMANMETLSCIKEFIRKFEERDILPELDYPFEFLDPLLCTLIKNPVILPGTLTIIERNVIEKQLLERPENPFDRSELTLEMLNEYNNTEAAQMAIQDHLGRLDRWISEQTEKKKVAPDDIDNNGTGQQEKNLDINQVSETDVKTNLESESESESEIHPDPESESKSESDIDADHITTSESDSESVPALSNDI